MARSAAAALQASKDKASTMAESPTHRYERRSRERNNIRYPVTINSSQGILPGETKNISPSGALIACACKELILPPEMLDLTIKRPPDTPVETSARVVWCSVHGFRTDRLICWLGVRFMR
jgi:PilZ domain